jgi:hypothetical protein
MKIYWSPSAQGFFDSRVNSTIPKDAVEISSSHRTDLIEGCKRNQVIVCRANGFPILAEATPTSSSPQESALAERQWRDVQLNDTDRLIARHRDELETKTTTTLTALQYAALQQYRSDLRDWPSSRQFPAVTGRPVLPGTRESGVKKMGVNKKATA